jgi:hypothetical protein
MNIMLKKSFLCLLFLVINIAQADPAPVPYDPYANDFSQLTGAVNNLGSSIDSLLNGYGKGMQAYIFQSPSYDLESLQTGGAAQDQLAQVPFKQAQPLTLQGVMNTLTAIDDTATAKNTIQSIPALLAPVPVTYAPGSRTPVPDPTALAAAKQNSTNFDLNSLLGTLQYDTNTQQTAQNFITLVSGLGYPLQVISFSGVPDKNIPTALNNAEVAKYLAALRTYTAQEAVGLSNLYHSYGERLPSTDLSALTNALPPPNPSSTLQALPVNPSALEVKEYLAKRRILDTNWYTQMSVASPIEVQRQTLYLLAEMRAEMFQQEMEMERLNTTLSVLVLQNAMGSRMLLAQTNDRVQPDKVATIVNGLRTNNTTQAIKPANLNQ